MQKTQFLVYHWLFLSCFGSCQHVPQQVVYGSCGQQALGGCNQKQISKQATKKQTL
jgi:hypothetical protein